MLVFHGPGLVRLLDRIVNRLHRRLCLSYPDKPETTSSSDWLVGATMQLAPGVPAAQLLASDAVSL